MFVKTPICHNFIEAIDSSIKYCQKQNPIFFSKSQTPSLIGQTTTRILSRIVFIFFYFHLIDDVEQLQKISWFWKFLKDWLNLGWYDRKCWWVQGSWIWNMVSKSKIKVEMSVFVTIWFLLLFHIIRFLS